MNECFCMKELTDFEDVRLKKCVKSQSILDHMMEFGQQL